MFLTKKINYWVTIFILIAIVILPSISPSMELIWITDDTPGGCYINGGGTEFDKQKPGVEIELYQMVGQKLGLNIVFKRFPWKRCLELIELNLVDGIFPASFKAERMNKGVYPMKKEIIDPSRKSRSNAYFLYKLKTNPISWNGKKFTNVSGSIGAPSGWAIVDDLKKNNLPIIETSINKDTINLLIHKRLQGFVCLETVFDSYIKDNPEKFSNIEKVVPPVWEKPYYLMFSHKFVKNYPELSEKIWDTIKDIRKSEEFKNLMHKYFNKN